MDDELVFPVAIPPDDGSGLVRMVQRLRSRCWLDGEIADMLRRMGVTDEEVVRLLVRSEDPGEPDWDRLDGATGAEWDRLFEEVSRG